jgi:hypothetical protein
MIAAMAEHKKKRRENIEDQRLFMEGSPGILFRSFLITAGKVSRSLEVRASHSAL